MSRSASDAFAEPPPDGARTRPHPDRLIEAWVAAACGQLDPAEREALARAEAGWQQHAAQLIAEGLLGYIALEMVSPDIAAARASGGAAPDGAELVARLPAHLREFADYRDRLELLGGEGPGPAR